MNNKDRAPLAVLLLLTSLQFLAVTGVLIASGFIPSMPYRQVCQISAAVSLLAGIALFGALISNLQFVECRGGTVNIDRNKFRVLGMVQLFATATAFATYAN